MDLQQLTVLNLVKLFCCLFSCNRLKSLVTAYTNTFILVTMKNWPINWEDRFHLKTWKFLMACSVLIQCLWWVTIWKEDQRKLSRTILTNPSFWEWKALWRAGGRVSTFVHPPTGWGKISIGFLRSKMLFPCNLKLKPFCNKLVTWLGRKLANFPQLFCSEGNFFSRVFLLSRRRRWIWVCSSHLST